MPASAEKVHAALTSEKYWRDRVEQIGGDGATLERVEVGEGTISVVLHQVIPEEELPSAVTAFKKGNLIIERTESWGPLHGDHADGTFGATVDGTPARIAGTTSLKGTGESTTVALSGTTEVKVPIFGGKIEQMITEQVLALIDVEQDFTGDWIKAQG